MARPTCLYCGAAFPEGAAAAPPPPAAPEPLPGGRALVVIDLRGADVERLGHALGLSPFDARQRVSSGGYQLHRALLPADADAEAARLRALGLPAHVVPPEEAAARCPSAAATTARDSCCARTKAPSASGRAGCS